MEQKPEPAIGQNEEQSRMTREGLVYLVPPGGVVSSGQTEISLADMLTTLWQSKGLILLISGLFALCGLAYALLAPSWYQAHVLLAPAKEKTMEGLPGQLGGLAGLVGLAGISVGGGAKAEAIAVLRSRDLTREFIEDEGVMAVLFAADWDTEAGRWRSSDPKDWPDIREGVRFFDENVRSVEVDRLTGLVTLAITWTDPAVAADWANKLVQHVNDTMRERTIKEAETNVVYLRRELEATNVVTLQQAIGRLLEGEIQKLMLAKGNTEFAFRVIDRAEEPKLRSWPRRALIVTVAVTVGGVLSILFVVIRNEVGRSRSKVTNWSAPKPD